MDAQPRRISADGRTTAQINVQVTQGGSPAPDGTEVRFTTTAGNIIPVARVVGGKATAILTSTSSGNIAEITAISGGASAIVQVEFVAGGYQQKDIVISAEGDLAYAVDGNIMIGSEAVFRHSEISIAAETIEYDEKRGQIRAQGNVLIESGDASISADALWYSPEDMAGAILVVGRQQQVIQYRSQELRIQNPTPATDLRQFEPFRVEHSRTWILAERAIIFPRERIQFTRAEVQLEGRPVLVLPHYVYDYRGTAYNPISQQFRYTDYEGMVVDLPFYLLFKEEQSSGVRLRYAGKGSSYGGFTTPRRGFSLGLEQVYNLKGGGGKMFVDSFPTNDRNFEWNHLQSFDAGQRLNASLRYQPSSDVAKNTLSGSASYSWQAKALDMTFSTYGSRSTNRSRNVSTSTMTTRLDVRGRSQQIGNLGLSWRPTAAIVNGPVTGHIDGSNRRLGTKLYQTAGINFAYKPIRTLFGSTLTLDSDLEAFVGGKQETSLRFKAGLNRSLGETGNLAISWEQALIGTGQYSRDYSKWLTASLSYGTINSFQIFGYASWLPETDSFNFTANATKNLGNEFRFEASHSFNKTTFDDTLLFDGSSKFGYTRLSVSKPIGLFQISVNFSPQGRDYGLRKSQKFWFEIGSRAF